MRFGTPRYPVDRYLVESSKQCEMVNIIDDDIWKSEPALKPEDEIMLRKLHEMLQSTADDLKLLSGELSKFHEPGVQVKTQPTPFDEEFNEKVHIEEVVNAKFRGLKIIDKQSTFPTCEAKDNGIKALANNLQKPKVNINVNTKVEPIPTKPVLIRNLGISRTKLMEINDKNDNKNKKMNSGKVINNVPAVAYNEFCFEYVEPKVNLIRNNLQIQEMPSINIRSELKEQKVLQLDIIPNAVREVKDTISKNNIAVILVEHATQSTPTRESKCEQPAKNYKEVFPQSNDIVKQPIRKVSKMSALESSGSTNNMSSDTQHNLRTQKQIKTVMGTSPKNSARVERKKSNVYQKELEKRTRLNLDKWKKKLSVVYGKPSTSRNSKITPKSTTNKVSPKKSSFLTRSDSKPQSNVLNKAEYIPYSQLTLGGVQVSDIEREILDIPNKNAIPLSPILDRILSSRENSFQNESPRKHRKKESSNLFTTSDENLLQEVIDIERTVSETISKNLVKTKNGGLKKTQNMSSESYNDKDNDSYADDFEDEIVNDEHSLHPDKNVPSNSSCSEQKDSLQSSSEENDEREMGKDDNVEKSDRHKIQTPQNIQNKTYIKSTNLSFKNSVDVFEYVHCLDVQDTATQSNTTHKISLKETQTSPTNDRPNIEPIHNDLWPSIDPKCEVEKIFKLEKEFIKKLLIDEYGDIMEKQINKPSTSRDSKNYDKEQNVTASQKNTQTSPAHVKSIMTSPKGTKTRTTSPFLSVTVDHQTSPMIVVTNDEKVIVEVDDDDDLGISINLSSPRFSLRLPQTSREVLTNLEECSTKRKSEKNIKDQCKVLQKISASSSSSVDGDKSSSEISSLGEVKLKLKRRLRKNRVAAISESSSSSTTSKYSSDLQSAGILPLKSEGEVSLEKRSKKVLNRASRSEGETSFGALSKG